MEQLKTCLVCEETNIRQCLPVQLVSLFMPPYGLVNANEQSVTLCLSFNIQMLQSFNCACERQNVHEWITTCVQRVH